MAKNMSTVDKTVNAKAVSAQSIVFGNMDGLNFNAQEAHKSNSH